MQHARELVALVVAATHQPTLMHAPPLTLRQNPAAPARLAHHQASSVPTLSSTHHAQACMLKNRKTTQIIPGRALQRPTQGHTSSPAARCTRVLECLSLAEAVAASATQAWLQAVTAAPGAAHTAALPPPQAPPALVAQAARGCAAAGSGPCLARRCSFSQSNSSNHNSSHHDKKSVQLVLRTQLAREPQP